MFSHAVAECEERNGSWVQRVEAEEPLASWDHHDELLPRKYFALVARLFYLIGSEKDIAVVNMQYSSFTVICRSSALNTSRRMTHSFHEFS